MNKKRISPARGEAHSNFGSLVTADISRNPAEGQRYYWSRKTNSVEQLRVIGGVVKW
jgi:hypothetical protein